MPSLGSDHSTSEDAPTGESVVKPPRFALVHLHSWRRGSGDDEKRYAKSVDGLERALGVQQLIHNWVRPHWSSGQTPAMALGFSARQVSLSEMISLRGFHELLPSAVSADQFDESAGALTCAPTNSSFFVYLNLNKLHPNPFFFVGVHGNALDDQYRRHKHTATLKPGFPTRQTSILLAPRRDIPPPLPTTESPSTATQTYMV